MPAGNEDVRLEEDDVDFIPAVPLASVSYRAHGIRHIRCGLDIDPASLLSCFFVFLAVYALAI